MVLGGFTSKYTHTIPDKEGAMESVKTRRCRECGKETEGSIGAAGVKWHDICQQCKNEADQVTMCRIASNHKIEKVLWKGILSEDAYEALYGGEK